jgi:hypothetical protein
MSNYAAIPHAHIKCQIIQPRLMRIQLPYLVVVLNIILGYKVGLHNLAFCMRMRRGCIVWHVVHVCGMVTQFGTLHAYEVWVF